jgi:small subunit ribosomal protein S13
MGMVVPTLAQRRLLVPPKKEEEKPAPAEAPEEKKGKKGEGKPKGEPKAKGDGKGKAPQVEKKPAKITPENPNFRHIVRLANTDLDGKRPVLMALTEVRGVGRRVAEAVTRLSGMDPKNRLGDLSEEQTDGIEQILLTLAQRVPQWMTNHPLDRNTGESHHVVAGDLESAVRDDINQMKMIRCYRGIRHERGQKVRGQRTRSNGRTGMAAGVIKKKAVAAAASAAQESGKKEK